MNCTYSYCSNNNNGYTGRLVSFPTNVFAQSGWYIHISGASLGDNLKVSAQTDQRSWEWRDCFIFAEHFYKSVSGVSPGEEINVCLTDFNTGIEDCDSGNSTTTLVQMYL